MPSRSSLPIDVVVVVVDGLIRWDFLLTLSFIKAKPHHIDWRIIRVIIVVVEVVVVIVVAVVVVVVVVIVVVIVNDLGFVSTSRDAGETIALS